MPIYEFECGKCGARFEELVKPGETAPCPQCKSSEVTRRYSPIGEGRVPVGLFGKAAAESNARRTEREARRQEKFRRTASGAAAKAPAPRPGRRSSPGSA